MLAQPRSRMDADGRRWHTPAMNWGLLATALLASAVPLWPAARGSDTAASEKRGATEAAATGGEAKAPTASGGTLGAPR